MLRLLLAGSMTDDGRRRKDASRKRRKKHDMRKMIFTNPHAMCREPHAFHHTLWYCNYVIGMATHDEKWSRLFRSRFIMPCSTFMDLTNKCLQYHYYEKWANARTHKFNKRLLTLLLMLM